MAMLLKGMQNAKKLNETMGNAYQINPKKTLGLSVIYSMPTGRPVEPIVLDSPPTDLRSGPLTMVPQ